MASALVGCKTVQEAAHDRCLQAGFKAGTDTFSECVVKASYMEQQQRDAAWQSYYVQQQMMQQQQMQQQQMDMMRRQSNRPLNCYTSGGYTTCY